MLDGLIIIVNNFIFNRDELEKKAGPQHLISYSIFMKPFSFNKVIPCAWCPKGRDSLYFPFRE